MGMGATLRIVALGWVPPFALLHCVMGATLRIVAL
jgi:hypothetical protein